MPTSELEQYIELLKSNVNGFILGDCHISNVHFDGQYFQINEITPNGQVTSTIKITSEEDDMLAELVEETNRHKKKTKDSEPKIMVRGLTDEEIERLLPW